MNRASQLRQTFIVCGLSMIFGGIGICPPSTSAACAGPFAAFEAARGNGINVNSASELQSRVVSPVIAVGDQPKFIEEDLRDLTDLEANAASLGRRRSLRQLSSKVARRGGSVFSRSHTLLAQHSFLRM